MKALRRNFFLTKFQRKCSSSKSIDFLAGLFAERSGIGLRCQLVINIDTRKLFAFTVGDGNSTHANLNFCDFSGFAFRGFAFAIGESFE